MGGEGGCMLGYPTKNVPENLTEPIFQIKRITHDNF